MFLSEQSNGRGPGGIGFSKGGAYRPGVGPGPPRPVRQSGILYQLPLPPFSRRPRAPGRSWW